MTINLFADADFSDFSEVVSELFDSMFAPLITIVISLCAVWGIFLGLKFWRSGGDENKRKEAKTAVIQFVIGIVVIFVVAACTPLLIAALQTWVSSV